MFGHGFLASHKRVPELLDVEVLPHFELRGVLVLVGSCLSDLLVPPLSLNPLLHGLLLVANTFLQLVDSLLAVSLLLLNIFHEPLKDGLRLQTLLLNLSLLLLF